MSRLRSGYTLLRDAPDILRHEGWLSLRIHIRAWWRGERDGLLRRRWQYPRPEYGQKLFDVIYERYTLYSADDEAYARHLARVEPHTPETFYAQYLEQIDYRSGEKLHFGIVSVIDANNPEGFKKTLHSVRYQTYDYWTWFVGILNADEVFREHLNTEIEDDPRLEVIWLEDDRGISENLNTVLREANTPFNLILYQGDLLVLNALFVVYKVLRRFPETDFVYSDHDFLNESDKRCNPCFKPDWSPELLLSENYLANLSVFRRNLLEKSGFFDSQMDGAHDWDLYLRMSEHTNRFIHIPQILYHRRGISVFSAEQIRTAAKRVLQAHLERCGLKSVVVDFEIEHPVPTIHPVVRWELQTQPHISIIIPSRDHSDILERCLSSIAGLTDYPNYDVVIVDSGSQEKATHKLYAAYTENANFDFQVVPFSSETFNFSRACNTGAAVAGGELLLFLNNDTEVLQGDWLHRMAQWFERDGIGVVGAKLLYPDMSIQHAGIVLGIGGLSAHLFAHEKEGIQTIFGSDAWYRNVLAVTGACLMVSRPVFEEIGGFDEAYTLYHSDVELCLEAIRNGYRIVYTPDVRLLHHEAVTSKLNITYEDYQRASRRWQHWFQQGDPYFNPNLSYKHSTPAFITGDFDTSAHSNVDFMNRIHRENSSGK
ncbi:MAG TPA: glycosyltransferase family 2 protein [Aggregatilineales bacterium]|nr:glycosyltransferase family 2 protein [Aggregatilineales bacterium]